MPQGFSLTPSGRRAAAGIGAVDVGRVAKRSAGAEVALGRPGGLLGFGTVVVLMLKPPVLRRALGRVWRSPRRSRLQQGGRGVGFWEGGAHHCGSGRCHRRYAPFSL